MGEPEVPPESTPAKPKSERISESRLVRVAPRSLRSLLPSSKQRVAIVREIALPLILALVPLFWVLDASHRVSVMTLGRDQGIFQYIAWATSLGDVDYRDVRDVNGPLVHLIHRVFLFFGGADEHRFHVLDLSVTALSFAFLGACLPGLVARRAPSFLERIAWGIAAAVVLSAQYQLYLYWNQAQRESFCDWFFLASVGLQVARPARTARAASWQLVAIGALSSITWLGKPSFALFTVMQLGVLLVDRGERGRPAFALDRKARVLRFAMGAALGVAVPFLYLVRVGDPVAWAKITFHDVPQVYRYIWAKSAREILSQDGPLAVVQAGLASSAILIGLVAFRELPRRVLALALTPIVALVSLLAQHKGFGYHFHPLTAATHASWMAIVIALSERFRHSPRKRPLGRWLAIAAAAGYALEIASSMKGSPQLRDPWILAGGETAEKRSQKEYFDAFKTYDFFPWDLREGARYLASHTSPDARVQVYGMDPYLLFLAKRRSATPYIYAYDLNADAALDGGWSNRPSEPEMALIRGVRWSHEMDMLRKLRARPPEAFVFIDHSPLMSFADAWEDFRWCCPDSAKWVGGNYHAAKSFGEVHIWLRDDTTVPDAEGLP
jgi:hypothetical protein